MITNEGLLKFYILVTVSVSVLSFTKIVLTYNGHIECAVVFISSCICGIIENIGDANRETVSGPAIAARWNVSRIVIDCGLHPVGYAGGQAVLCRVGHICRAVVYSRNFIIWENANITFVKCFHLSHIHVQLNTLCVHYWTWAYPVIL